MPTEQQHDDDERLHQPPRREQRHLDGSVAVRRVLSRHPGTLPVRHALQSPQAAVDAVHERLGERLAAPDHRHQRRPGEQVGDVVLAEVDEGEAERRRRRSSRARPRPCRLPRARARRPSEVAKCSEGIAAQGLPPSASYIFGQAEPQVSSPTSTMIRRTSSPGQALLRGPPGRRRRHREVDGAAEVEDGGHLAGGAREALVVADQDQRPAPGRARRTRASGSR